MSYRMTEGVKRAPVAPCHECPWRVSNQGRPVPEKYAGTYDRDQRVTLWSQLRDVGIVQSCHLSTGDREKFPNGGDPEWTAMGFEAIPEHAQPRECGGAVAAAMRELRRLAEAGSWEEYNRRRPNGFTREAASLWLLRMRGGRVPGFPPLRTGDVDEGEIIDPACADDPTALELLTRTQVIALRSALDRVAGMLSVSPAEPS